MGESNLKSIAHNISAHQRRPARSGKQSACVGTVRPHLQPLLDETQSVDLHLLAILAVVVAQYRPAHWKPMLKHLAGDDSTTQMSQSQLA